MPRRGRSGPLRRSAPPPDVPLLQDSTTEMPRENEAMGLKLEDAEPLQAPAQQQHLPFQAELFDRMRQNATGSKSSLVGCPHWRQFIAEGDGEETLLQSMQYVALSRVLRAQLQRVNDVMPHKRSASSAFSKEGKKRKGGGKREKVEQQSTNAVCQNEEQQHQQRADSPGTADDATDVEDGSDDGSGKTRITDDQASVDVTANGNDETKSNGSESARRASVASTCGGNGTCDRQDSSIDCSSANTSGDGEFNFAGPSAGEVAALQLCRHIDLPINCFECGGADGVLTPVRLGICLHCVFVGCWKWPSFLSRPNHVPGNNWFAGHMVEHLLLNQHTFAYDLSSDRIYCAACQSSLLHDDFAKTILANEIADATVLLQDLGLFVSSTARIRQILWSHACEQQLVESRHRQQLREYSLVVQNHIIASRRAQMGESTSVEEMERLHGPIDREFLLQYVRSAHAQQRTKNFLREKHLASQRDFDAIASLYPSPRTVPFSPWAPSASELCVIQASADHISTPAATLGLRGMVNLGNTCFLNCIVQCLCHAPLFREYFLSDSHNRRLCTGRLRRASAYAEAKQKLANSAAWDALSEPTVLRRMKSRTSIYDYVPTISVPEKLRLERESLVAQIPYAGEPSRRQDVDVEIGSFVTAPQLRTAAEQVVKAKAHDADRHNASKAAVSALNRGEDQAVCFGCEFDFLHTQFFSGDSDPFAPIHFLHSVWREPGMSKEFAGSNQQDAHEFLINILNTLHGHVGGVGTARTAARRAASVYGSAGDNYRSSRPGVSSSSEDHMSCRCCVHMLFGGMLRSTVQCCKCAGVSSSFEPFFDISLHIDTSTAGNTHTRSEFATGAYAEPPSLARKGSVDAVPPDDTEAVSLQDCLKTFTKAEALGSDAPVMCGQCSSSQEAVKQFTFQSMPPLLVFHIKRFERRTKIDTWVRFPFTLDMAPYSPTVADASLNSPSSSTSELVYDLVSVVTHRGTMTSGHYTCFVRHRGAWYRCDDAWIAPASPEQVAAAQAYLLFYVKRELQYEVS